MTQRVTRSITVRRPHDEVAAFATDPHRVLEVIPGFARFEYVGDAPSNAELWDVFLEVGTLHVGGRVLVTHPSPHRLEWRSQRGTAHTFSMTVEPLGEHARLTMSLTYTFAGWLSARVSEVVARGIAARHLDAGLEQIRHLLEHSRRGSRPAGTP
jgi:carbon monoxide dehydrogenase subunit G